MLWKPISISLCFLAPLLFARPLSECDQYRNPAKAADCRKGNSDKVANLTFSLGTKTASSGKEAVSSSNQPSSSSQGSSSVADQAQSSQASSSSTSP